MGELLREEQLHEEKDLVRGLKGRHIQMIAIGGAIGVGLFLGSARAIQAAGPALLLSYALVGIVIFFIMRALGELLLYRPVAGSFATYAEEFIGPWAGFFTGWSYWFMWVVTGMAEITAVAVYVNYWFPDVPHWIPALITLAVLYTANLIAVGVFGEFEFWFAIIKVVTIVALIAIGLVVILFGFGELGQTASFSNLWAHGGFAPMGVAGVILSLQVVAFAFLGVELVPWNQLDPKQSPFVLVFDRIGIPAAGGIINFVVITAAASSCNSGIFSTGRMLYTLAQFGQAPRFLGKVNAGHVPAVGVTISAAVMLIGVLLNYVVPEQVFVWVISVATVGALWTWAMILIAHMGYRKAVAEGRAQPSPFRMPGSPVANWIALAFIVLVTCFLALDPSTRVALYVGPVWFAILALGYQLSKSRELAAA
jgi:AAT family amino acid transporter/D-serine/D-alanine/glycine transporter